MWIGFCDFLVFYVLVWYQPCVILARGHQECIEKGVAFCLQEGKAGVWFPKQVTDEVVHHDILGHLNERLQVRQGRTCRKWQVA